MKSLILLSGGLDSTLCLALALEKGRQCHTLSFDYGQRHRAELNAAKAIAEHYNVPQHLVTLDPTCFAGSALTGDKPIPKGRSQETIAKDAAPTTYVPARNTLFLAYATAFAETLGAEEIYLGANADDLTGYPDCRPAFIEAFQQVLNVATQQATTGAPCRLITPLIQWDKARIMAEAATRNVPIDLTLSCYDPTPDGHPCHQCDACILRLTQR